MPAWVRHAARLVRPAQAAKHLLAPAQTRHARSVRLLGKCTKNGSLAGAPSPVHPSAVGARQGIRTPTTTLEGSGAAVTPASRVGPPSISARGPATSG